MILTHRIRLAGAWNYLFSACILWFGAWGGASEAAGQQFCGFDALHAIHRGDEPACNERILGQILLGSDRTGDALTIPVVFHIIHEGGPENIPDDAVHQSIDLLNDAFSNNGAYATEQGVNTGIQFCLAAVDPEGAFSSGIERVESGLTDVLVPAEEAALKALSHWDGTQYLNVWVVDAITREESNEGVVGFATFPTLHGEPLDGVVVERSAVGVSATANAVLAHEVGHYLGLYHTFQGGCPNDDCLTAGDRVCDTPPDAAAFNLICFDGTNSCSTDADDASINNPFRAPELGGLGDQLDMQTNFMDYANLTCFERFTAGQADRMVASLMEIRSSLLEGDRCSGPCGDPIEVDVVASSLVIEVGESVSFVNTSSNVQGVEWFVDGASQGQEQDFQFAPAEAGDYLVSVVLEGDEPGCTETVAFQVEVVCPVTASFTGGAVHFEAGGSYEAANTSSGANSYAWYVDGEPVSTDENPTFTFEDAGAYTLQLAATGPTCTDWSAPQNLSVGTCTSGNESNVWLFFNASGSGHGLDFNTDPPTPVAENNLPPEADHCKATLCDEGGNVLFVSTGTEVLNSNFEVMPNGDDLFGNTSSHYGTMLVAQPESQHMHYVFYSSLPDDPNEGGLHYALIDETLDGGLGDVTVKNAFLGAYGQEAMTCVRHCNLVDFWLITYDQIEGRYLAWLVTAEGINPAPVSSEIAQDVYYTLPLTPSAKGDQIMHGKYLMDFDASTGELVVAATFELNDIVGWEFSGNGRFLYLFHGEFATTITQVDLWNFDANDPLADAATVDSPAGFIYIYPQRAPDGNIYFENPFGGDIARIVAPNLPADDLIFEASFVNFQSLINSFGNYFHRYVQGESLFIEGDAVACAGTPMAYAVYGSDCLQGDVEWTVAGADYEELANGVIEVVFPAAGFVTLTAAMELACGVVDQTLTVHVLPDPGLNLGADFGSCGAGVEQALDAGPGFNSYLWNSGETTSTLAVSEPGVYGVTVDAGGCFAYDEVEVLDAAVAPIDLGPDVTLCDGEILVLDAGTGYNDYTWQDGAAGPTYTAFEAGTYVVSASLPCYASDTLVVIDCGEGIGLEVEGSDRAQLQVFPNPNPGTFEVLWAADDRPERWALFSLAGQQVATGAVTGRDRLTVRVDLAAGSYWLQLEGAGPPRYQQVVIE